ncbi:MAG: hypothetical protein IJU78_05840 [Clostridia bacterium]|nr:hypothetical protein [Clostridia bacterium]
MLTWWEGLSALGRVFACAAVPATVLLLIQLALMLFGAGDADEGDGADLADLDGDGIPDAFEADGFPDLDGNGIPDYLETDGGAAEPAHGGGLHLFTLRGVTAFFAVGGWSGLAALAGGLSPAASAAIAYIAGVAAMLLLALLLRAVMGLQESGTLDLRGAVGLRGTAYIPVPPAGEGVGKITLLLQGRLTECEAVSDGERIPSGAGVTVTGMYSPDTLTVHCEMEE